MNLNDICEEVLSSIELFKNPYITYVGENGDYIILRFWSISLEEKEKKWNEDRKTMYDGRLKDVPFMVFQPLFRIYLKKEGKISNLDRDYERESAFYENFKEIEFDRKKYGRERYE